jgi:hypothetical protein
MRIPYYCPYCDQRSTRRWNLDIHIKRRHGGYLLGRSSDRYIANNHAAYSKGIQLGHATVADSVGNTFLNMHLPQQTPLPIPIYRPPHTIHDQSYRTGLSQEAILKIEELKRLVNKYPQYCTNPDSIIRLAIYNAINADNTLLDNKLEQLRTIDRRLNGWS